LFTNQVVAKAASRTTQGLTPDTIANAVFDAIGIRLRELPFTAEKVRQGLVRNR
jgi:hypothetical protein